jgi:predicted RNA-binding Zn ribbon-like protein
VKQCPHGGCAWFFLDASKNASRRWCSMQDCGAKVKSRRQYQRRKLEVA